MRRIHLLAVGKLRSSHCRGLCHDYLKRLQPYARVDVIEIKDSSAERESARLIESLTRLDAKAIALSEEGRQLTSRAFAELIGQQTRDLAFVIGGPYGLTDELKQSAAKTLSLSPMTLPHELARVVFLEQLYRAHTILAGSGYHHE